MKKVIWITGGGTGIGKAVAIKFANQGWNVAISGRRENILKEAKLLEGAGVFSIVLECV